MSKASKAVFAGRWLSLAFWIVLAFALVQIAPNLQEEANTSQQAARSQSTLESLKAGELIAEKFPDVQEAMNNRVTVTFYRASGLTGDDEAYGRALERFLTARRADIRLRSSTSPFSGGRGMDNLRSEDGEAALLALDLDMEYASRDSNAWLSQTKDVIPRIRNYLSPDEGVRGGAPAAPDGLSVHLAGNNAVWGDVFTLQEESLSRTLVMTLVFILVVLLIIYRSPVAAIFPLISVVLALTISQGALGIAADAGLSVSPNALVFLIVVLFGLGTDHSLLMFSRFRDNLLAGKDRKEAARSAVANGGEAILASACAVVVAFGCMAFARDANLKGIGPPLAIAVSLEFLVIMTLIPAFIAIVGEKVFWPFLPSRARARRMREGAEQTAAKAGIWERIATSVTGRPNRFIAVAVIVLLPLVGLVAGFRYDNNELRALLPTSTDSYQGLTVVREHFGQGVGAENTVAVVIESDRTRWDGGALRTVERVSGDIDDLPGVSMVTTATRPSGGELTPQALQELVGAGGGSGRDDVSIFALPGDALEQYPAVRPYVEEYLSGDGTSVILNVTLNHDPYSDAALDTVTAIRATLRNSLAGTELASSTAYVGGVTAEVRDNLETQRNDFVFIIVVVLCGIFVILALLLRSLVAPLYMVGTIVLAFAATTGLTFATFKYGFGFSGLFFDTPVVSFIILVALGIDYSIFLMTRVKEEYRANQLSTREAVRNALAGTGPVITSCGIILAGTFTPLLFSGIKTYVEMGFAVVVGLLLDTFVIRTLLVPAIAVRVGELNWWPRRPRRVVDDVRASTEESPVHSAAQNMEVSR